LQAYTVTDAGGEINCLDPGSFGPLEIIHSLTISCETGTAGVLSNFFDDFIISLGPTDVVYLRGLDINGSFSGSGPDAIVVNGGSGAVHVEKCLIHGFTGNGIFFEPKGTASLFVADTVVADNGSAGSGGNILAATS
jgi:hypothetical protein